MFLRPQGELATSLFCTPLSTLLNLLCPKPPDQGTKVTILSLCHMYFCNAYAVYIFITKVKLFYTTLKCSRCKVKDPLSSCKPLLTFGCLLLDLISHICTDHVISLQNPHLLDWEKLIPRPTLSPILSLVSLMGSQACKETTEPWLFLLGLLFPFAGVGSGVKR